MRIEFVPDGSQDCPAILFHGCPSAGAETLLNAFRLLAEGPATEVALHQLSDLDPVGDIQVFATNANGRAGIEQLSVLAFRWRQEREGWLQAAELAEPVVHSDGSEGTRFQYLERNGKFHVILSTGRRW